jgi:hypothetical protein
MWVGKDVWYSQVVALFCVVCQHHHLHRRKFVNVNASDGSFQVRAGACAYDRALLVVEHVDCRASVRTRVCMYVRVRVRARFLASVVVCAVRWLHPPLHILTCAFVFYV